MRHSYAVLSEPTKENVSGYLRNPCSKRDAACPSSLRCRQVGSRCTTLIMLSLRSRAGDPAAQRWYRNCGDGTWHLLLGTRVTYVTETFPFSRSLRFMSDDRWNWDPYQSTTGAAQKYCCPRAEVGKIFRPEGHIKFCRPSEGPHAKSLIKLFIIYLQWRCAWNKYYLTETVVALTH